MINSLYAPLASENCRRKEGIRFFLSFVCHIICNEENKCFHSTELGIQFGLFNVNHYYFFFLCFGSHNNIKSIRIFDIFSLCFQLFTIS